MELLTIIGIILFFVWYTHTVLNNVLNYWKNKGVFYVQPSYLFGNFLDVVLRKKSFADALRVLYYSNDDARYIGTYQLWKPILLLKDPDLIKQILTKECDSFPNRGYVNAEQVDPLWSSTLMAKTVQNGWQESRATVLPYFSAKSVRIMIPLIQSSAQNLIKFLKSKRGSVVLDVKDVFTKLASDVIASVAFGITVDSFQDQQNSFLLMAKKTVDFSGLRGFTLFVYGSFPKLLNVFNLKIFGKDIVEFFGSIIKDTLEFRRKHNIYRPDFLQLLTEDRHVANEKISINNNDILAHCITFVFVGFESMSTMLTYLAYELALNADIQKKLYEEVTQTLNSTDGNLTYELISEMQYLKAVVSEILRLHLSAFIAERKCLKPFTIMPKNAGELPLIIQKNDRVWIPLREIQRDPKYFPNPLKFDPNRFLNGNEAKFVPNTYLPFGYGPRHCIAVKYNLLKLKVVLIEILKSYEFIRVDKTKVPISLRTDTLLAAPEDGVWIGFKPRDED